MHTLVPPCLGHQCHNVAADLCLGIYLPEDGHRCVCMYAWYGCRHGHGIHAGTDVCLPGTVHESWGATRDLDWGAVPVCCSVMLSPRYP